MKRFLVLTLAVLASFSSSVMPVFAAEGDLHSAGQTVRRFGKEQPIAARLEELLTVISSQSIHGAPSSEELATALRVFVRAVDPYGDYLRPEVYTAMKSMSDSYTGIGLDVFWDKNGRFLCIPAPGSPAAEAGVMYGYELLAVGGHDARILGVEDVGYLLRGDPGTLVSIRIRSPATGEIKDLYIKRRTIPRVSVARISGSIQGAGPMQGVRILRFTERTPQEIFDLLGRQDLSGGLIIDLRGNTGGDFHGAVRTAGLFLGQGSIICRQRNKSGEKVFRSEQKLLSPGRIYIWQDRLTASAAEVFLAAIVENRQGVSIGATSFGKGYSQAVIELLKGGAVLLSNAELLTPSGRKFDGIGLAPAYVLSGDVSFSDLAYREAMRGLLLSRGEQGSHDPSSSWLRRLLGD